MLSVYEEIHLTTLYIYLLDRFFFCTCLPKNLLRDREMKVNVSEVLLSGSSLSKSPGTTEGGRKAGVTFKMYHEG